MPSVPVLMSGKIVNSPFAILTCVILRTFLGAFWYSFNGLGRLWIKNLPSQIRLRIQSQDNDATVPMLSSLVCSFVEIFVLNHILQFLAVTAVVEAIEVAFWTWLGFKASYAHHYFWSDYSPICFFVDTTFDLACLIICAVFLSQFGY